MQRIPLLDPSRWLSPFWFRWDVLSGYTFENPVFLYLIPAVPLLYILKWALHYRFRERIEVAFMTPDKKSDPSVWLRFLPPGIQSLALAFMLLAMARPQRTSELTEQKSEGIDIVIAIDISESMRMEDLKPNRLEAAKQVAIDFINGRRMDRMGMVIFAGDAFSLCPLTTDLELLNDYVDDIDFGIIGKPGTAIGSALAVATNRLAESKSKTKLVILLSDGDNTAGNLDPVTAARLAASYGVKVYSIAAGKDGPVAMGSDLFGNPNYIESNMDESTLRQIAEIGGGQFFRATNNQTLANIFKKIDQFEKSEIKIRRYKQTQDYYTVYLNWALVFLLSWLITKSTFMTNALED